jgi:hypothetical protein
MAFCEMSIGLRYSSSRISPGVMLVLLMGITYRVIVGWSRWNIIGIRIVEGVNHWEKLNHGIH